MACLFITFALIGVALGSAIPDTARYPSVELNNLTGLSTLTAFAPWIPAYNGAKINNLNLFQAKVAQYCPFIGNEPGYCPNGTDMAFASTLYPVR
jgi:hypothetical protein